MKSVGGPGSSYGGKGYFVKEFLQQTEQLPHLRSQPFVVYCETRRSPLRYTPSSQAVRSRQACGFLASPLRLDPAPLQHLIVPCIYHHAAYAADIVQVFCWETRVLQTSVTFAHIPSPCTVVICDGDFLCYQMTV